MKSKRNDVYLERELHKYASMTDLLRQRKIRFENRIIEQKVIEANYYISRQLEVPLATKVFYLKRLRIVEGEPKSIENNYICYEYANALENANFENESFREVVEMCTKQKIVKSSESISIVEANDEERKWLDLPENEEVVLIKGTTYTEDNKPFEYFELVNIPSFYRFRSVSKG